MIENQELNKFENNKKERINEIWKSAPKKGLEYSLVKVPIDTPVYLTLNKPRTNEEIQFFPTNNKAFWQIRGLLNFRSLYQLRLLIKPENYKEFGLISDFELDTLSPFGEISRYTNHLYLTNLTLYTKRIRDYLNDMWTPYEKIKKPQSVPFIRLGENTPDAYRFLPQIKPIDSIVGFKPSLIVNKY